jgi:hypothetical protein
MLYGDGVSELNKQNRRQRAFAILEKRDGPNCFYCGVTFNEVEGTASRATLTHGGLGRSRTLDRFIPRELGGRANIENLRMSCYKCNRMKGSMPGPDFLASKMLAKRKKTITEQEMIARGLRPKGGYWHADIDNGEYGKGGPLRCRACGAESWSIDAPLNAVPCTVTGWRNPENWPSPVGVT